MRAEITAKDMREPAMLRRTDRDADIEDVLLSIYWRKPAKLPPHTL